MTSRLQLIVLAALFSIQTLTASAANQSSDEETAPWYEIELIIFAHKKQTGMTTETWPENPKNKNYTRAYDLALPGEAEFFEPMLTTQQMRIGDAIEGALQTDFSLYNDGAYTMVETKLLRMRDLYQKLSQSGDYQPLVHIAWRQPTAVREQALPVFVFEGMTIPDEIRLKSTQVGTPIQTSGSQRNTNDPFASQYARPQYASAADTLVGPQLQRLYGTVRVSVSRYLHVDTDLHLRLPVLVQEQITTEPAMDPAASDSFFYTKPEPTTSIIERETLRDFALIESRRMRSKEVHHLDNPLFGFIVLVNPYELPKPPPIEQPQIELQPLPTTKPVKNR